jgi:Zn-dependent M28 family amino/carboxypeptidase
MDPRDESSNVRARRIVFSVAGVFIVITAVVMVSLTLQPSFKRYPPSTAQVDPNGLQAHVITLSETFALRTYTNKQNLNNTADYIASQFDGAGGQLSEQAFVVNGNQYRNVIAAFGPESSDRIVVGAHYDSYGNSPGADDNASGIAGLIELAYLLGRTELAQRVELVAYTLEEPPFFRSDNMGSARHAAMLRKGRVDVEAMICLEMIGYYSDEKNSQLFPSVLLKWLYPDKGNYIAVIGSWGDRKLVKQVKVSMRSATDLPVHAMCAPKGFPGLDFSDHLNYWNNGYAAVMITDTAFMRNPNYHRESDTADTLDYHRMARVVTGVYEAVVYLAGKEN